MSNKIIDTPGTYNYRGFSIVTAEAGRLTITDGCTGRVVIQDEIFKDINSLERILNIINSSR